MTLRLILFRHAKSSWDDALLDDHDRPLNERGTAAASAMGRWLSQQPFRPNLVLCSDAQRTKATLSLAQVAMGPPAPETEVDGALYLATPETILDAVRAAAKRKPEADTIMVIGHNPGLHALALTLIDRAAAGGAGASDLRSLEAKFPTAAMAVLDLGGLNFHEPLAGRCRLEAFQIPRAL